MRSRIPTPLAVFSEYFGLSKLFPRSRRLGAYRMTWFGYDEVAEVDQVMGIVHDYLSRRSTPLVCSTRTPIFFNEVDWCLRAKQAGWKVYFTLTPKSCIWEAKARNSEEQDAVESQLSLERFYCKHYKGRIPALVYWLVIAGIRLNTRLIRRQGKELRD